MGWATNCRLSCAVPPCCCMVTAEMATATGRSGQSDLIEISGPADRPSWLRPLPIPGPRRTCNKSTASTARCQTTCWVRSRRSLSRRSPPMARRRQSGELPCHQPTRRPHASVGSSQQYADNLAAGESTSAKLIHEQPGQLLPEHRGDLCRCASGQPGPSLLARSRKGSGRASPPISTPTTRPKLIPLLAKATACAPSCACTMTSGCARAISWPLAADYKSRWQTAAATTRPPPAAPLPSRCSIFRWSMPPPARRRSLAPSTSRRANCPTRRLTRQMCGGPSCSRPRRSRPRRSRSS